MISSNAVIGCRCRYLAHRAFTTSIPKQHAPRMLMSVPTSSYIKHPTMSMRYASSSSSSTANNATNKLSTAASKSNKEGVAGWRVKYSSPRYAL